MRLFTPNGNVGKIKNSLSKKNFPSGTEEAPKGRWGRQNWPASIKLCIYVHVRTTIDIDDKIFAAAQALHKDLNKTQLIDFALSELVRLQKSRELAKLAGRFPHLTDVPRRKFQ